MKKIFCLLGLIISMPLLSNCKSGYDDNCPYLTFNAEEESIVSYEIINKNEKVDVNLQYSTNMTDWQDWEIVKEEGTVKTAKEINIKKGDKIYVQNTKEHLSVWYDDFVHFLIPSGKIAASGDISSLKKAEELGNYEYTRLFKKCSNLVRAPKFPATIVSSKCCEYTFEKCTNLTIAPELPATTLASDCYLGMFFDCTSLSIAPTLPATELASGCYKNMFENCSSLKEVKVSFNMFENKSRTSNWLSNAGTNVSNPTFTWKGGEIPEEERSNSTVPSYWKVVSEQ